MLGKRGKKFILYKYAWYFSVYIYTHPPGVIKSDVPKTSINSHAPIFVFQKKIFLHYSLRETKYQKNSWTWRFGMQMSALSRNVIDHWKYRQQRQFEAFIANQQTSNITNISKQHIHHLWRKLFYTYKYFAFRRSEIKLIN